MLKIGKCRKLGVGHLFFAFDNDTEALRSRHWRDDTVYSHRVCHSIFTRHDRRTLGTAKSAAFTFGWRTSLTAWAAARRRRGDRRRCITHIPDHPLNALSRV